MYELKIYRGIICHKNEEWCKNWSELDLLIQNWHEEFDDFSLENLKNLHFNGLLLTKVHNFWAKKSTEELGFIALKIDVKFKGKLTCTF